MTSATMSEQADLTGMVFPDEEYHTPGKNDNDIAENDNNQAGQEVDDDNVFVDTDNADVARNDHVIRGGKGRAEVNSDDDEGNSDNEEVAPEEFARAEIGDDAKLLELVLKSIDRYNNRLGSTHASNVLVRSVKRSCDNAYKAKISGEA
jgi:hypothetical protein